MIKRFVMMIIGMLFFTTTVFAAGENKGVKVNFLLQAQSAFTTSDADGDDYWRNNSMVRRARILLSGKITDNVSFFAETDDYKIGQSSDGQNAKTTFIQDAYINYKIKNELQIAAGLILPALMHHNRASAVTLLGLDYNAQVPLAANVWRDAGIEFRGLLLKGMIDYHVGVFNGTSVTDFTSGDPVSGIGSYKTEEDSPRVTARLQINLLDAETKFYYSENYLGDKKIFSVGFGVDYQANGYQQSATADIKDYFAWTADLTVDMPLQENVLALRAAYINSKNNPQNGLLDATYYFVQAGFAVMNKTIQPVLKYAVSDIKDTSVSTTFAIGVNYYIKKHNANLKLEYANTTVDPDGGDKVTGQEIKVQGQVFL